MSEWLLLNSPYYNSKVFSDNKYRKKQLQLSSGIYKENNKPGKQQLTK